MPPLVRSAAAVVLRWEVVRLRSLDAAAAAAAAWVDNAVHADLCLAATMLRVAVVAVVGTGVKRATTVRHPLSRQLALLASVSDNIVSKNVKAAERAAARLFW